MTAAPPLLGQFFALVTQHRTHGLDTPRALYLDTVHALRRLHPAADTAVPFRADRVCDRVGRVLQIVERGPHFTAGDCHSLCAERSSILQAAQSFAAATAREDA